MIIQPQQLAQHLKKIAPLYCVSGDEPLLTLEACDQIRAAAKQKGFCDREIFYINTQFNWQSFFNSTDNLSLFSEKKLIELRFEQKPDKAAREALQHYCQSLSETIVVLITMGKLEAASKKAKWFKTLEGAGVCLFIWPISAQQFPNWLAQRFQQANLQADQAAINLVCEQTEGNLLAAKQEVEKLALLYPEQTITAEHIALATSESYRYDIFNLVDTCLEGQVKQIAKVLENLRQEGTEAILVLWALARETRNLLKMVEFMKQGQSLDNTFKQFKIWEKRKPLLRCYFSRCKTSQLYRQLQLTTTIDQQIKGLQAGNPWESLLVLALNFSDKRVIS